MYDNSSLTTVLKNTSGRELVCSFLPPHGRTLSVGEEIEVVGDIIEAIRHSKRTGAARVINSYLKALDDGLITIISTPAPVLQDSFTGRTRMLELHRGLLRVIEPTWEESLSE